MSRGVFISIEGTDGAGKSTQIKLLKEYLTNKGHEVVLLREPGGTKIGEKIRNIILDVSNSEMDAITEMMLYASARAQIINEIILPALEIGKTVVCDRFVDSSYVYQGVARGLGIDTVVNVNRIATKDIMPNITLFFDLHPDLSLERRKLASVTDRIERENMDFHYKVYNGYKEIAKRFSSRIKVIDSSKGIDEIHTNVKTLMEEYFLRSE